MTRALPGDLPIVLVPHPHVRTDRRVLRGSPHVQGTRVLVRRLLAFYRNGATVDQLLRRFPQLTPARLFDALAFAFDNPEVMDADVERERQLLGKVAPRGAAPAGEQLALRFDAPAPRRRRR